jgi:hypothetical protein
MRPLNVRSSFGYHTYTNTSSSYFFSAALAAYAQDRSKLSVYVLLPEGGEEVISFSFLFDTIELMNG